MSHHNDTHPVNFSASVRGFKCFACGTSGSLRELALKLGVDLLRCFPARDVPYPPPPTLESHAAYKQVLKAQAMGS